MTAAGRARAGAGRRALACAALGIGSLAAQGSDVEEDPQPAHDLRVELERRESFRRAWLAAPEASRERAREHLLARREAAAPLGSRPSVELLCEATWVLSAGDLKSYPALERVADLLDLRVFPGAFEARSEGRGEPVTVRVAPLVFADPPRVMRMRLTWIDPGGREILARDEEVLRPALAPPGFDMFIHAPLSAPGSWRLAGEVTSGSSRGETFPVSVECVADLRARIAALPAAMAGDPRLEALHECVDGGLRPASGATAAELLAALEADARTGSVRGESLRPVARAFPWPAAHAASNEIWELATGAERPARAVLLIDSLDLPPEAAFAGTLGEAWSAAARDGGLVLLATGSPIEPAGIASIAQQLAAERGIETLVLLARGSAAADALALAARIAEAGVDALAVATVAGTEGREPRALPLPALVVDAGAVEDATSRIAASDAPALTWVRRRAPPIAVDLELFDLVAKWLAAESALDVELGSDGRKAQDAHPR